MANYGQYYPNYLSNYQQPQQIAQPSQDERIWVQNETSAEAYLVAPNSFVRLWDANQPVFYEKRADASGRPYLMDVYEYKRREPHTGAKESDMDKSLREDLESQIKALTQRIEALESNKKGVIKNAKSNTDDTSI